MRQQIIPIFNFNFTNTILLKHVLILQAVISNILENINVVRASPVSISPLKIKARLRELVRKRSTDGNSLE